MDYDYSIRSMGHGFRGASPRAPGKRWSLPENRAMSDEVGWVIVRDLPGQLGYFAGANEYSTDNLRAIRFARRIDALNMMIYLHGGLDDHPDRVEEHAWVDRTCRNEDSV